ncbi:MAG: radical SAM protein [Dehalococcoidia bacterium]|jgi:MoaA/NifB/PqqE/SkfB family radical SAM enzyme|nr:radical SAM protein [Dehalococcoidia bacterium]
MSEFSVDAGARLLHKGITNYVRSRPLIISYEVTLSCNCNCRHCDLGGLRPDETRLLPADYARLTAMYRPPLVQVSGGEPLLRSDVVDIVRAVKHAHEPTYVIVVTNGALLDESLYVRLREAGMNQLSVSLDFPDERHDDFRRHRGLFRHLERTLPGLAALGNGDIIMNTAITRANQHELLSISDLVARWGVTISYSAYTQLRTGNPEYMISSPEDLAALGSAFSELMRRSHTQKHIANPETVFRDTLAYFRRGGMPHCGAGVRFFVVMPDGALIPCSLHRQRYTTQKEMADGFSACNKCEQCYVSIRSYSDKPLLKLFVQDLPSLARRLFDRYTPAPAVEGGVEAQGSGKRLTRE